jgi:hypothetical protein
MILQALDSTTQELTMQRKTLVESELEQAPANPDKEMGCQDQEITMSKEELVVPHMVSVLEVGFISKRMRPQVQDNTNCLTTLLLYPDTKCQINLII